MQLTPQNVEDLFRRCLFDKGEDTTNHVPAEGVQLNTGFHPERLQANKPKIAELVAELPKEFQPGNQGGSFRNMCHDKEGTLWTGEHRVMDQLLCLGIASETLKYCLARPLWHLLPGGMPAVLATI